MMNLQIGCGKAYIPGWENVDIFSNVHADVYSSALALPFPPESFDLIYASHVLEHLNRHIIMTALYHWRHLLKPGGILRISVPDFEAIIEYYQKTKDLRVIMGLLYGGQNSMLNVHHIVFDFSTLYAMLISTGFTDVYKWDWRKTEHSHIDDYSQAYLPHMDKDNGLLMSLNLEAVK